MKRSPMKPGKGFKPRQTPLRATAPAKAEVKLPNVRKCKVCSDPFRPSRALQTWCGPDCGVKLAAKLVAKKEAKAAADDKRRTKAQLEQLKTVPQLKKEAQAAFNKYVRLRDAGRNCISCNTPPPDMAGLHAGRDAGHWRSTGAADHLRFHEDNCHAQCVKCNQYKAGNAVEYRAGLIWRIGPARVEALETNNTPVKWTRDGLREIRDTYRRRANELERSMK